jgi:hypothetical protein
LNHEDDNLFYGIKNICIFLELKKLIGVLYKLTVDQLSPAEGDWPWAVAMLSFFRHRANHFQQQQLDYGWHWQMGPRLSSIAACGTGRTTHGDSGCPIMVERNFFKPYQLILYNKINQMRERERNM